MFNFNGWAVVRYHTHGTDFACQDKCWAAFLDYLQTVPVPESISIKISNGVHLFSIAGCHNHHGEYVFEPFDWLARHAAGSFGLLYVWDDEDQRGFDNCFRVWRLCRGSVTENDDPFLSPCIPTVEDPYDPDLPD